MGNSGSNHGHHSKAGGAHSVISGDQQQQYLQSLPHDGRTAGIHGKGQNPTAFRTSQPKFYGNGTGFKVLPERVPGQKLRMTDNGNVLQNGGTLSGRRPANDSGPVQSDSELDPDFVRLMQKRRSDVIHETGEEEFVTTEFHSMDSNTTSAALRHSNNAASRMTKGPGENGLLSAGKKYHSNPDLLHSHGIMSGHPSGMMMMMMPKSLQPPAASDNFDRHMVSGKKSKKSPKKGKAPSPPSLNYHGEDANHSGQSQNFVKENHSKKGFAQFLRGSSPKKLVASNNIIPTTPDPKDKAVTYVLERREPPHGSSGVLNLTQLPPSTPSQHATSSSNDPIRERQFHNKRGQLPDRTSSFLPPTAATPPPPHPNLLNHPHLQNKLSDGAHMHARSMDRSESRLHGNQNSHLDLQNKRVRSMDSLACSSADDRDIYHRHHLSPLPHLLSRNTPLQERFTRINKELNQSLTQEMPFHSASGKLSESGLRRRPSNCNGSLLSNNPKREETASSSWEKQQVQQSRKIYAASGAISEPLHSAAISASHERPTKHNEQWQPSLHRSNSNTAHKPYYYEGQSNLGAGSLDRNGIDDTKFYHQKKASGRPGHPIVTPLPNILAAELNTIIAERHHGRHTDKNKINRHAFSKDDRNKNDPSNKDAVADHLQEAFFAKTKETRAEVIEYNRKLSSGRHNDTGNHAQLAGNPTGDGDLSSEDEMDINMQLRPTLPRRLAAMPRFSPTQVWRSFSLGDESTTAATNAENKLSEHSNSDGEEVDVFEDRIQRIARPVAPPRSNNEKSADSGISPGAVSPIPVLYDFETVMIPEKPAPPPPPPPLQPPHPHVASTPPPPPPPPNYTPASISPNKAMEMDAIGANNLDSLNSVNEIPITATVEQNRMKTMWTPEEDLASDFDGGSDQAPANPLWPGSSTPGMICSQPKLTSRKDMFAFKRSFANQQDHQMDPQQDVAQNSGAKSDFSEIEFRSHPRSTSKKHQRGGPINKNNASDHQKYNSVRKLKRSLSGVLQGHGCSSGKASEDPQTSLDDNWSLSRSLPNSLHNGHEGHRSPEHKKPTAIMRPRSEHAAQLPNRYHAAKSEMRPRLPRSESGPIYSMSSQEAEMVERQPFADLEGRVFADEKAQSMVRPSYSNQHGQQHIVYLPKYEAMQIIMENGGDPLTYERRAYSDLGTTTGIHSEHLGHKNGSGGAHHNHPFKRPKKFTYQSTVRQLERKQLEKKLSEEVAIKEKQRNREMALVNKVEEEFQKKRDREKAAIRQQLRILSLDGSTKTEGEYSENVDSSLPQEFSSGHGDVNGHFTYLGETCSGTDKRNNGSRNPTPPMSLPHFLIPPEDYDVSLTKTLEPRYSTSSLPYTSQQLPLRASGIRTGGGSGGSGGGGQGERGSSSDTGSGGGFFSGIGKWMRRQQRIEKHPNDHRVSGPSRQEPDGAPASSVFSGSTRQAHHEGQMPHFTGPQPLPPSPQHQNRSMAIIGAKFSSGRNPDEQLLAKPKSPTNVHQEKKNIYSQLADVAQKEEHFQKCNPQQTKSYPESRTSVWISAQPLKGTANTPMPKTSHSSSYGGASDFYDIPYDSLPHGSQNGSYHTPTSNRPAGSSYQYIPNSSSSLQREWNAGPGQRHSIAIEPSREYWNNSSGPGRQSYDNRQRTREDNHSQLFSTHSGSQANGPPSSELGWQHRDLGRQDSYREAVEGSSLDYRRHYVEPQTSLGVHHRSLSYSQIWDGGPTNGKNTEASPRPSLVPVQPFNPNKMYRPVAFQAGSSK